MERNGQGAKGRGNELARERIGQSPIGGFAPGSEKARYRLKLWTLEERRSRHNNINTTVN